MTRDDIIRMAREATAHLPDADSIRLQGIVLLALDAGEQAEREAWEPVQDSEWEVRADGKRVRKDRWQIGIRRIAALLWGNRQEFEVDEVVEAVRHLVPNPYAEGDDEALVKAVLDAAIRARGNT